MSARTLAWTAVCAFVAGCGGVSAAPDGGPIASDGGGVADGRTPSETGARPDAGTRPEGGAATDGRCSAPTRVDCDGGPCAVIALAGDPPDKPLDFHGYLDPSLVHDPAVAGRHWLAYSHLDPGVTPSPDGGTYIEGIVSTHLAMSTNDGASFSYVAPLWPADKTVDPDGGAMTYLNSEVPSLAVVQDAGQVTWYGEHLRYIQRPIAGYNPDFTGSWVIRVGAAVSSSPAALADAKESVLARATVDAAAWGVTTVLDDISPAGAVSDCYFMNNPAITFRDGKLYLAATCWVSASGGEDVTKTRILLYSTTASGPAPTWTWKYVGVLADHTLAQQLGGETLDQPDFSYAVDGTLLLLLSPTMGTSHSIDTGCVALAMTSLDPPTYAKGCDGGLDVRAVLTGFGSSSDGLGACTHDATSASGILGVRQAGSGLNLVLVATGLKP